MLKFCDFIQVHVFTTNHHLKERIIQNLGFFFFLKSKIKIYSQFLEMICCEMNLSKF